MFTSAFLNLGIRLSHHRDPPPRDGGGALELDQLSLESSLPRSLQLPELDGGGAEPPAALLK